jgi:hypothetical protein
MTPMAGSNPAANTDAFDWWGKMRQPQFNMALTGRRADLARLVTTHFSAIAECPLCANSGHSRTSNGRGLLLDLISR